MAVNNDEEPLPKSHLRSDRFRGFFEHVNGRLIPVFGPAELGPYEDSGVPSAHVCPICGHEMTEHVIDREPANHLLFCPVHEEHPPLEVEGPLNEFGMIKPSPSVKPSPGIKPSPRGEKHRPKRDGATG